MLSIKAIWFGSGSIHAKLTDGNTYSQPLEAYPTLMDATPVQRENFYLWSDNESARWPEVDEDIHVTNFLDTFEVNRDNWVNRIFESLPWLDPRKFAQMAKMHKSKLDRYRYGIRTPGERETKDIYQALHCVVKDVQDLIITSE